MCQYWNKYAAGLFFIIRKKSHSNGSETLNQQGAQLHEESETVNRDLQVWILGGVEL